MHDAVPTDPAPAVAVVIPAHEAASTLGAALASVAAQTFVPAEVVVVDDGSTDGTVPVAESWAGMLPVTVMKATGRGAAAARHEGVAVATSDLIALLDADDVWLPDHLATMVRTWHGHADRLVSASALLWVPGERVWRGRPRRVPPQEDQLHQLLQANFASGSAMFGRSLYERAGGFRDGFTIGEDWDLWIRMVRAGAVVVRTDHPTFCYRLTPGSLTAGGRRYEGAELVLQAAVREAATEEQRQWADEGLRRQRQLQRHARAGMALVDAYTAARRGATAEARRQARRSLPGAVPVALRGLAVLAWPALAVRIRDRVDGSVASR